MRALLLFAAVILAASVQSGTFAAQPQSGTSIERNLQTDGTDLPIPDSWRITRLADGKVVGQVDLAVAAGYATRLQIPERGKTYEVVRFNQDGTLKHVDSSSVPPIAPMDIVLVGLPLKDGQKMPEFEPGTLWYKAAKPGGAIVYAKQITPGETWLFQSGDFRVAADKPFDPNSVLSFEFSSEYEGKTERSGNASIEYGFWSELGFSGKNYVIAMAPGAYPEELPGKQEGEEWLKMPVDPEFGVFYVRAGAPGQVWTITVGGKEYTRTVTYADIVLEQDNPRPPWNAPG